MNRAPARSLAAALALLALSLTACGTTVPLTTTTAGATGDGLGGLSTGPSGAVDPITGAPLSTSGAEGTTTSSGPAGGAAVGGPATTKGSRPGSVVQGSTSTPAGGSAAFAGARGVTAKTITLGIAVATGEADLANSLGVSGAGTVGVQDMMQVVVDEVNRTGGVLGRRLAMYVHTFDAATGVANPAQTVNEICTDFRDDHKVFAVLFDIGFPEMRKCLAEMGSPLIVLNGVSSLVPASAYAAYGGNYLYGPTAITAERLAKLFVDSLLARQFTERWNTTDGGPGGLTPTKLGVIHVDSPDQNALYAAYAAELAKHGLKFDDTVTYNQDVSAALAATQNAVLKFRADGITHVFGASTFFLSNAESQNYRPRYAYLPGLGTLGVANAPAAQLRGALTVGWTPAADVNASEDPGDTPAASRCRAMMKKARLSTANRADLNRMYAVCDAVLSVSAALTAGGAPSVAGLRRGYESLGSGFPSALTFGVTLDPSRHYGVNQVRDMAFDSECGCLKYTSRTNRS